MKFYDTCSLLKKVDNLFDEEEFAISSITLNELEGIKTSATKDPDVKFAARKILHLLDENPEKYQVVLYYTYMIDSFPNFDVTNDLKSCSSYFLISNFFMIHLNHFLKSI